MRIRTSRRSPAAFAWKAALIALAIFAAFNLRLSSAENTPQTLPFAQDWTNIGLITTSDDWVGVPGISGYRGDNLAATGADPQFVLADGTEVLDVNANQAIPNTFTTGGVAEFAITDPVVALQGSGTADAPFLLLSLSTTGQQNIRIRYNARDIDGSADNAVQQLALHFRVGNSGNFTNVPAGYIADASSGPNLATLVTAVDVVLPAAVDNLPLVQLRIITADAPFSDEWIGIDDIAVSGTPIPGDQAPSVTSTTPAANALNVPVNSNITVNFSEAVDLGAGAVTVQCPAGTPIATSLVAANITQLVLDPASDLPAGTTCAVLIESTLVTDSDGNDPPNELPADVSFTFSTVAAVVTCTSPFTPIYSIQGSGASAAITGIVTTRGVVVGDHEGAAPALRGFYLQDVTGDGVAETSDALFVFNGNANSVSLGDLVYVTGTAGEFQDQTQISSVTGIVDCDEDVSVAATEVTFPVPDTIPPYLERFEGMLVQLTQTLYVTELFQLGRFGQVTVSVDDRLAQPTNVVAPGAAANALQAANNRSRIILDDVLNNQNPDPIQFGRGGVPLSAANTLRGGDTVIGFTGVLNYTWGGNSSSPNAYRVRPVDGQQSNVPNFAPANPRPTSVPVVGGNLKVASFNVLNYFLTLDVGTQQNCGPVGSKQECRGAETAEELTRQQLKLTEALYALDADVVGLMEIENSQDAGGNNVEPLAQIVADLNARYGAATYDYVDTGIVGTDTIRVGYIFKPAKATAIAGGLFVDGAAAHNRPPVSQLFQSASGGKFNVVVSHFKSKSCSGVVAGSPDSDQGDGQGCFNAARIAQANALVAFINSTVVPTTGDSDVLIIGDLNAYAMENPVSIIKAAGYTNLVLQFGGPEAYSYVFDGQWGYLDHALASTSLLPQVSAAADYHINADEPSVLDYNINFKSAGQVVSLFSPDQYRTSDHDPVVVGLALTREPARICLNLGNDASQFLPDTDSFTFQGIAGDFVRIRVEQAAPVAQGRASLLVTGPFFLKLNMSALPNEVSGNILRSGRHTIFLSELFGRDSFRGNYCLLVSSTGGSQTTLQGTSLAE